MANYTGANVINAGDASNYQADIYTFGIGADTSEVAFFITQTTNDILRQLRIEWFPTYKSNIYTDITVLKEIVKSSKIEDLAKNSDIHRRR